MECKSCGAQIDDSSSQCPYCNASVSRTSSGPAPGSGSYQGGPAPAPAPGHGGPQPPANAPNKMLIGLLAIFLGCFGVHKFLLGYMKPGIIMAAVTVIAPIVTHGFGPVIMGLVGVIEGIIYLTKSDSEFYNTYVVNKKEWF